jgi:hypothetical protein
MQQQQPTASGVFSSRDSPSVPGPATFLAKNIDFVYASQLCCWYSLMAACARAAEENSCGCNILLDLLGAWGVRASRHSQKTTE